MLYWKSFSLIILFINSRLHSREDLFYLFFQLRKVLPCSLPSGSGINAIIVMHQHVAHTYHILPLHFGMLHLQILCKVVGSLSYYLNILHHSIKEYLISA